MIYAPVIIPTLCRYKHLKNLIDSLLLNKGVDKTDLFLAVDFPSRENHKDGHRKILEYAKNISGFKSVTIIEREENFGSARNSKALRMLVESKYDRVIYTEDDNIFAPNFLEFINKGLEKYAYDDSVFAVCGYRHFYDIKFDENNYFFQSNDFSAWGYGYWVEKRYRMLDNVDNNFFLDILRNPKKLYNAYKRGWKHISTLVYASGKNWNINPRYIDSVLSVIIYWKKKRVVMPTVSKVLNTGWDGSGNSGFVSSKLQEAHETQELDTSLDFDYLGTDSYYDYNNRVYINQNYAKVNRLVVFIRLIRRIFYGG